jgi:beta-glucosidase-like glycosyl hydrolase
LVLYGGKLLAVAGGYRVVDQAIVGGTVFPELVTQGSTWDVELVQEIGAAIALEASAMGIDLVCVPVKIRSTPLR